MLADKFKLVGGGDFNLPLVPQGNGSGFLYLKALGVDACGNPSPDLQTQTGVEGWETNISAQGPFNNIGVPNISLLTAPLPPLIILPSYGYLTRMTTDLSHSYVDLISQTTADIDPTFFTLWLGGNDVLLYAATGGGYNPDPCGDINVLIANPTEQGAFETTYTQILDILLANNPNRQGAIATIPNITALPFFTTVGIKAQNPSDCNGALLDIWVTDSDDNVRIAQEGEFIPLSGGANIGVPDAEGRPHGLHPDNPLCKGEILKVEQVAIANAALDGYNTFIRNQAAERDLALVDMAAFMDDVKNNGLTVDGIGVNADFLTGGAFGLDGVHPTDRGYAIIANEFIKSINAKYGATLPMVDVTIYKGIAFP